MPRGQAEDYGDKRQEILDAAAAVFARVGYANTKMMDVARVCGASKSMLYHYFPRKEGVLFEIMFRHLETLREATEEVIARAALPEQRLREFIHMWIRKSAEARSRHAVLMHDLKFLPPRQQKAVTEVERRLVDLVANLVGEVNPRQRELNWARSYARLLFGALNWTDMWYRSTGPVSPDAMSEHIFRMFMQGLAAER